jgi:hypothetical protein
MAYQARRAASRPICARFGSAPAHRRVAQPGRGMPPLMLDMSIWWAQAWGEVPAAISRTKRGSRFNQTAQVEPIEKLDRGADVAVLTSAHPTRLPGQLGPAVPASRAKRFRCKLTRNLKEADLCAVWTAQAADLRRWRSGHPPHVEHFCGLRGRSPVLPIFLPIFAPSRSVARITAIGIMRSPDGREGGEA